jgi:hypothetical protein
MKTLAQVQTSVPAEVLQNPEQIPFEMAVVKALSMKVLNMTLEGVFLTERPMGERLNLMKHDWHHRKLVKTERQTIVDTALSEICMAARPGHV